MPSVSALPGSGPIYGTGTSDYSKKQNMTKEFKDPNTYSSLWGPSPTIGLKTLGYGYVGDAQLNAYVNSLKPQPDYGYGFNKGGGFSFGPSATNTGAQLQFAKNKAKFYGMIKNNPNMTYNTQAANMKNGGLKNYLGKALYNMMMGNRPQGFGLFKP